MLLRKIDPLAVILAGAALRHHITRPGTWGPLMVIGSTVRVILVSPIPTS